jgi:hypothetical protein
VLRNFDEIFFIHDEGKRVCEVSAQLKKITKKSFRDGFCQLSQKNFELELE